MNIQDIQHQKEGQTFDCKSVQIDPKALAIPIVAMANADGGMLAIGISDKTRRLEGIDRICLELEKHGSAIPTFRLDAFILKATLKAEWTSEMEADRLSTAKVPSKYRSSTAQVPPKYRPSTAQVPPK